MLIETDTGGEREIGANPYEHSSPMGVLDIEVILIDPTPLHLEMPTIVFPDGGHVGGGLTCFDNGYNLIGLGTLEVALHKVIAPAWGIFLNGYTPFLGAVLDPMVILGGDVAQQLPTDGIDLAIEVEKADGTLWLLKGLNRGMKQDAIEATVGETDVILDRKSTRLNSSHGYISYAVFCLKKTTAHWWLYSHFIALPLGWASVAMYDRKVPILMGPNNSMNTGLNMTILGYLATMFTIGVNG